MTGARDWHPFRVIKAAIQADSALGVCDLVQMTYLFPEFVFPSVR